MKKKLHLLIALVFGLCMNAQTTTVSITGTGTGGWNQPGAVALTSTDGENFTKTNFEIINDGQIKFSENGNWDLTNGFSTATAAPGFPNGIAGANTTLKDPIDPANPTATINNNIIATPGFWSVTYNIVTKAYAFTAGVNPNPTVNITGGGLDAAIIMNTANGVAYNKQSVTFGGGDGAFAQAGTNLTWGGPFPEGPVVAGASIPVPAGTYNVFFTRSSNPEFVFEPVVVGMIGNFVGSGWGGTVDLATTDGVHFTRSNYTFKSAWGDPYCHFKITDNHSWNVQFGKTEEFNNIPEASGIAINSGSSKDLVIEFGRYDIAFNRSTGEYAFTLLAPYPIIKVSGAAIGATDIALDTTDGEHYSTKSLVCGADTAKFIQDGTENQWSSASLSGTGTQNGALISLTEAVYNVDFTVSTGVYSFSNITVSMIGGHNDWGNGGPDIDLTSTDGINYSVMHQVLAGDVKFRDNHDWAHSFGGSVKPCLFPIGTGGGESNIVVPSGVYDISFNRNTLAYNFATSAVFSYYADADADGYGDVAADVVVFYTSGTHAGYSANNTDCDDTKAAVHPGATDTANGIDDNCNGTVDEGTTPAAPTAGAGACVGSPVTGAATALSGYSLKWYTTLTGVTALPTAPLATAKAVKYYVSQKLGAGTESPRLLVTVTGLALKAKSGALKLTNGTATTAITAVGCYVGTNTALTLTATAGASSYDWTLPTGIVRTAANGVGTNSSTTSTDAFIYVKFSASDLNTAYAKVTVKSFNALGCGSLLNGESVAFTRAIPAVLKTLVLTNGTATTAITDVSLYSGVDTELTLTATPATTAGLTPTSYKWVLPTTIISSDATCVNAQTGFYTSTSNVIHVNLKNVLPATTSLVINAHAVNGAGTSVAKVLPLKRVLPTAPKVTGSLSVCNIGTGFNYTITANAKAIKYLITGPVGSTVTSDNGVSGASANILTTSDLTFKVVYASVSVSTKLTLDIKSINGAGQTAKGTVLKLTELVTCAAGAKVAPVASVFKVVAYPNPSTEGFKINSSNRKPFGVQVYDMLGRSIEQRQLKSDSQIGANYARGIYNVIVTQDAQVKTLRLIKK